MKGMIPNCACGRKGYVKKNNCGVCERCYKLEEDRRGFNHHYVRPTIRLAMEVYNFVSDNGMTPRRVGRY